MDNTAQNQAQTTVPAQPPQQVPVQSQPPVPIVQPVQPAPVLQPQVEEITDPVSVDPQSSTPVSPVSLPHREAGPGFGKMSEFITPTETAPVLSSEVKEAGVEVAPDMEQPVIPSDVAKAGLQPAKAAVPVAQVTGSAISYLTDAPFSPEEAVKIEKSTRASDSIRWLATFLLRQLKKITLLGKS